MKHLLCLTALWLMLFSAGAWAGKSETDAVQKNFQNDMEAWTRRVSGAATDDARAAALKQRPDPAKYAIAMWAVIGPALREEWTLEPAAWFLGLTNGLRVVQPNGSSSPQFAEQAAAIQAAIEAYHMKTPKLAPVCLALGGRNDPRALALLEKIQTNHQEKSVQGVAALAVAIRLRGMGDDPKAIAKRLTLLRKAAIDSSHVVVNGVAVSEMVKDEIYIISHLSKGREAPDLDGVDSGGRPMKLSDYRGKVVVLLFWNASMPDAKLSLAMAKALQKHFAGKPFVVLGVNNDTQANLRQMQSADDLIGFPNFSDPKNALAREYRIGTWPLVYVLDGTRKIHYAGVPGSFVELTAAALLDGAAPAPEK